LKTSTREEQGVQPREFKQAPCRLARQGPKFWLLPRKAAESPGGALSLSRDIECKSSAVTLSDMEVFIFPELMFSLVLANIMSPRIWRWREDPWFAGLEKMKPYRRITRVKQFIMDHYTFNLDLDTWGLTTKEKELARFRDFVDAGMLAQSNALFGYEGDKYYFDIDIRTHFGLDKYGGNVIPYWKTETVEAMDAFRHRPGYPTGAGECVSLAALYAAALFLIARIPLKDIFMLATPLHSQNFVDVDDGVLTNNRRLVTKTMWFNGTELSAQARRALENERVTIVTHESGWIHTMYPDATIEQGAYAHISQRLRHFVTTPLTSELLINYLRHNHELQKCFQMRWPLHGVDHYVALDKVFGYEHGSSFSVTDKTREKLMAEVDSELFQPHPLSSRIVINDLEEFVRTNRIDIHRPEELFRLKAKFACDCFNAETAIDALRRFCHTDPRLPDAAAKTFRPSGDAINLNPEMSREETLERLESIRSRNQFADLAFYAYRDLRRTEAEPFLVAAVRRSPVSIAATAGLDEVAMADRVRALADESIYDDAGRLAQPDEVWNFGRGDGLEKAVLLANLIRSRRPGADMTIRIEGGQAVLTADGVSWSFATGKGLSDRTWPVPQV
jgi:hypothetical protein